MLPRMGSRLPSSLWESISIHDDFVEGVRDESSNLQALSLLGTWLSLGLGLAVGSGRRTLDALLLLRRAHDRRNGRTVRTRSGWVGV